MRIKRLFRPSDAHDWRPSHIARRLHPPLEMDFLKVMSGWVTEISKASKMNRALFSLRGNSFFVIFSKLFVKYARIAQLVEHITDTDGVLGSNPSTRTKIQIRTKIPESQLFHRPYTICEQLVHCFVHFLICILQNEVHSLQRIAFPGIPKESGTARYVSV